MIVAICNWCKLPTGKRGTNSKGEPCPCRCHNDADEIE